MHNPFRVVEMFEENLAEYTKAPYACAVNSGTSALQLAFRWWWLNADRETITVTLPARTYRSVAIQAEAEGLIVKFADWDWARAYNIPPTNIWDYALTLEYGMYEKSQIQCLSFHPQKQLALANGGGAILHDSGGLQKWLKQQRWDGREGPSIADDDIHCLGAHCYMFPATAGEALHRLAIYACRPAFPLEHPKYEDLSKKWRW